MKKTLKSILALATAALLGSSAQADATIELKVGERFPLTDTDNYSFTYSSGNRWYKLSTANNTGTNEFVQGVFEDAHSSKSFLSNGAQGTTKFYFVGTKPTTQAQVLKLFRCSAATDAQGNSLVPDTDQQYAYRGYEGKSQDSNQWMACNGHTYTITVTEPEYKLVENPVIVKATRVTFSDNQTKTETQYDGFLTEKGCQYAWGKDGSPTTAWTEPSDGTPCDLAKPGDATQLFVKGPTK